MTREQIAIEWSDELGLTESEIEEALQADEAFFRFEVKVYDFLDLDLGKIRYFAEYSNGQVWDRGFNGDTVQEAIDFVAPMIRDEAAKINDTKKQAIKISDMLVNSYYHAESQTQITEVFKVLDIREYLGRQCADMVNMENPNHTATIGLDRINWGFMDGTWKRFVVTK